MSKRLFVVTAPFDARHKSEGSTRTLQMGEELFADHPVAGNYVVFEQDNEEFQAEAEVFSASTVLKSEFDKWIDQPSFGGAHTPKCKGCGHQKVEHKNRRGACTAMKVQASRQIPCDCQAFQAIS